MDCLGRIIRLFILHALVMLWPAKSTSKGGDISLHSPTVKGRSAPLSFTLSSPLFSPLHFPLLPFPEIHPRFTLFLFLLVSGERLYFGVFPDSWTPFVLQYALFQLAPFKVIMHAHLLGLETKDLELLLIANSHLAPLWKMLIRKGTNKSLLYVMIF